MNHHSIKLNIFIIKNQWKYLICLTYQTLPFNAYTLTRLRLSMFRLSMFRLSMFRLLMCFFLMLGFKCFVLNVSTWNVFSWNVLLTLSMFRLSMFCFQSMNDSHASLRCLFKYIVPVLAFSVLFNIPKFLESEVKFDSDFPDEIYLDVTELRTNPGTTLKDKMTKSPFHSLPVTLKKKTTKRIKGHFFQHSLNGKTTFLISLAQICSQNSVLSKAPLFF